MVVAAIGAVAAAWKVFDYYSEENVLKRNLEEAQKAAENAKTAYEELKTTITSYSDARKNIESLTEGTVEFYEAILAANERAEELIETLNLLPTSGYTIGANGLIQINEDVLENAMSEKMREQYRTQAHVAQGKADLEKVHQKEIIRDFMLAVNQQAAKQGSIAKIDQSQAKIILDNYNKDDSVWIGELQRAIEMGSHMGEMQYKTLEDINRTSVKNSEGICKAVGKTSENLEASIGDQEIKIGETIDDFLPDYLASQAKIDNYEAMAIENDLYSYLDDTQLTSYQNLSHGSQDAIRKIMKQKKAESRSNVQYDESLDRWGMAEDIDKKSS